MSSVFLSLQNQLSLPSLFKMLRLRRLGQRASSFLKQRIFRATMTRQRLYVCVYTHRSSGPGMQVRAITKTVPATIHDKLRDSSEDDASKQGMRCACACPDMPVYLGTRCQPVATAPLSSVSFPVVVFCPTRHTCITFFTARRRSRPSSIIGAKLAAFYTPIRPHQST